MLSVGWLIIAVVVAILLTAWVTFTATRLDRLHARVDAAQAALDAQLVRRSAALAQVADRGSEALGSSASAEIAAVTRHALDAGPAEREQAENAVGKASNELAGRAGDLPPTLDADVREVADAALRVVMARRFYNDAVRDTRLLRAARMPRILHLAGHREVPQFFDIDDSTLWTLNTPRPGGLS